LPFILSYDQIIVFKIFPYNRHIWCDL